MKDAALDQRSQTLMEESGRRVAPIGRNLLRGTWSQAEIHSLLARHPRVPLMPSLGSSEWLSVARNPHVQQLLAPLRARALEECCAELPSLTDDLYSSFHRTDIRLTFENVYFDRRYQLGRAVMSLLLAAEDDPWRERLSQSVVAKFQDIAEEPSWALPAHVNWHKDDPSGKEPMQIDLLCADTANLMAEMLDLFPSLIPTPLRQQVRDRLHEQVFTNYLSRDFHWLDVTHNWNSVCHQGVIGAALSQVADDAMLAAMLLRMREKLPLFLKGFSADGGCSEGASYWDYGFGKFAVLNEQLEIRTGGELSLFAGDAHVREIAAYGPKMALSGGYLVNFADSEAAGGLDPALLCYLGERLGDQDIKSAAVEQYRYLMTGGLSTDHKKGDVYSLSRWMRRMPQEIPEVARVPTDCYLPNLEVLVARNRDADGRLWEFAAKGGHNGEHHNHNDCGSFLIHIDSERLITELGAPEYVRDYFGPKRYEFTAARSGGHSVPLINDQEQSEGAEFKAEVLKCEITDEAGELSLNLTGCYPAEARCLKAIRTFLWEKESNTIEVVDDFELMEPGQFVSTLISGYPVRVHDGSVEIPGEKVSLNISCDPDALLITSEDISHRDRLGREMVSFRVHFEYRAPVAAGTIRFKISACRYLS